MDETQLIKSCLQGNRQSLEDLVKSIGGMVFNICLRFLWSRQDAEDASQEILVRVITNLSKFKGNSKFSTWVYRIAVNYLVDLKQTSIEKSLVSFDVFAEDLKTFYGYATYDLADKALMEKEMKIGCTLAMLQCLDREERLVFIIGSILRIKSNIACSILSVKPENFRKKLQFARNKIRDFMENNCGVYNPLNSCRCNKRIHTALLCGKINRGYLNFADKIETYNAEMEELSAMSGIYNNHGQFASGKDLTAQLNLMLNSKTIVSYNTD